MPTFTLKGAIRLDGSQWNAGLEQAKRRANTWSADVSNMIRSRLSRAFAMAAVAAGVDNRTARAGQVRDQSTALGLDIETFQKIDFAASQSGASIDDASKAIKRLSVSMLDALRGSKEISEAYARFGITAEHLAKLKADPDSMFFLLSELVQKGVNPTELGDLQRIAGKSSATLIPAFKAGFSDAAALAAQSGVVTPEDEILSLASAGDQILTAKRQAGRAADKAIITAGKGFDAPRSIQTLSETARLKIDAGQLELQRKQLEATLELKQVARETAENTRPLNE